MRCCLRMLLRCQAALLREQRRVQLQQGQGLRVGLWRLRPDGPWRSARCARSLALRDAAERAPGLPPRLLLRPMLMRLPLPLPLPRLRVLARALRHRPMRLLARRLRLRLAHRRGAAVAVAPAALPSCR